jgi:hypothetical protein
MAKASDVYETEINREETGPKDKPAHDQWHIRTGDRDIIKNERGEGVRYRLNEIIYDIVQALRVRHELRIPSIRRRTPFPNPASRSSSKVTPSGLRLKSSEL